MDIPLPRKGSVLSGEREKQSKSTKIDEFRRKSGRKDSKSMLLVGWKESKAIEVRLKPIYHEKRICSHNDKAPESDNGSGAGFVL